MGQPPIMDSVPNVDALLADEGTRVEWKENGADVAGIVRTLSAFANDYGKQGGGWVICGIEEQRNEHGFSEASKAGLEAARYRELRNKVVDWCHRYVKPAIDPEISTVPVSEHPERQLLVFHVAASKHVHWVEDDKETGTWVWYRIDSHTRKAPREVIAALMRDKGESPPFLDEVCAEAAVDDLDPLLVERALRPLNLPRPVQDYLQPGMRVNARTPPLVVRDPSSGRAIPTRLAVLLACREPVRFLRGAYAILAVYDGTVKASGHSQRFDLSSPLPQLISDVISRLQAHIGYDVDKTASVTTGVQNRPRYARRAVEEAVVNAFAHRDYASSDPVRIDVFADRIELWNPGGLARGLDEMGLAKGSVPPSWRNISLVSFLIGLGLVQEMGQGLETIIKESQRVTGKRPELHSRGESFQVVLPAYRPTLSPWQSPPSPAASKTDRSGIFLISIGGSSIRPMAEHSFIELGLLSDDVLVDFATAFIEPHSPGWTEQAERLRDEIARWVENPAYGRFHLFYRGPVVMAPLIGAVVAPVKPLVIYYFENGRYSPAYTLDRRFLHGAHQGPGSA